MTIENMMKILEYLHISVHCPSANARNLTHLLQRLAKHPKDKPSPLCRLKNIPCDMKRSAFDRTTRLGRAKEHSAYLNET